MTGRDEIIRMAVEAGCSAGMRASLILGQERDLEWLRRFYELAVAAEREACAKQIEEYADFVEESAEAHGIDDPMPACLRRLAAAIRARGTL